MQNGRVDPIGVARGRGQKGHDPPKFLKNIIILCFERRFSKQNSVVRLKSYILALLNFWAGYATGWFVFQSWTLNTTGQLLCTVSLQVSRNKNKDFETT